MKEVDEGLNDLENVVDPVRGGRIALKATALVLILSVLGGFVLATLRVGNATVESVGEQGRKSVADEGWLVRRAAEIRSLGREIQAAKEAFERKKAEADSRLISRQDDRAELDRLNGVILDLEAKRAEAIKEWDVMAASAGTAAIWSER